MARFWRICVVFLQVKWQRREISNFEYLMYLNTVAGRTLQRFEPIPRLSLDFGELRVEGTRFVTAGELSWLVEGKFSIDWLID